MMVNQTLNHNCINRFGVCDKGPAHHRESVNPQHSQIVIKQSENHKHDLFRLGSWNVGTLRGRVGKIDICCVEEVWWQGVSTRPVTGKNSQYKFFWIGNETRNGGVGIFVAKKWIKKVLEVKRVSDRLMMIKLQTDKRTLVVVSTCAPQQNLTDYEKNCLYESIIWLIASINEKDMAIIGSYLNGHIRKKWMDMIVFMGVIDLA